MKNLLIILLLVVAGSFNKANAQKPAVVLSDKSGWHKIAETSVDLKKDRDEVAVLVANRFSSLKFKVVDAAINFMHAEIYYSQGDSQHVAINKVFSAPGETQTIELQNAIERDIKKVALVYKTLPNRKEEKARVEIWGLKVNLDSK